jgi:hypothetical protein
MVNLAARMSCTKTSNLFLAFEPLSGWRHVDVTAQSTVVDFAKQMRVLVFTGGVK